MAPRLGVNLLQSEPSAWLDDCRRVEALGFHELSASDHLAKGSKNPMVALAAAAAVTERISLSTMVLDNTLRHPAELAAEAALLQVIADGRFVLGIGAGHSEAEHRSIGLPLPPAAERLDRLEAAVMALRPLLRGETVSVVGEHLSLEEHQTWPASSRVPLLIGGGSPRLIEIAARHADVVGFTGFASSAGDRMRLNHFSTAGLQDRWDRVQEAAGERAPALGYQLLVQGVRFGSDRARAAKTLAADWTAGGQSITADELLDCPFVLLGTPDDMAEQMHEAQARWGIGTWTTFVGRPVDPPLEAVAEIAQALG